MKDFSLIHELRLQGVEWDIIKDSVEWFTDNDRKVYAGWLLGKEENNNTNNDIVKNAKTLQSIRLARKGLGIERAINNEQIRDIALYQSFNYQMINAIEKKYDTLDFNDIKVENKSKEKAHIFTLADFHYKGDETQLFEKILHDEQVYERISRLFGDTEKLNIAA